MGKVLHASYSGYLPFCIDEGDPSQVGPGTVHPVGMSIDEVIKIYWRIKKFNGSGPVFNPIAQADVQYFQNDFVYSFLTPSFEEDIVCYRKGVYFLSSQVVTLYEYFDQIYVDIFSLTQSTSRVLKIGDIYYPSIVASGDASIGPYPFTVYGSFSLQLPGLIQDGQINFFGHIILLYRDPVATLPYFGSIYATEYWSYGGTWDTTTGQPL